MRDDCSGLSFPENVALKYEHIFHLIINMSVIDNSIANNSIIT